MILNPIAVNSAVMSISCGDPELEAAIESQLDLMERMSCVGECNTTLAFISLQKAMVELAQSAVRNKVTTIKLRAQATSTTVFRSLSWRNTEGQSTSQNRGCSWGEASSFTGFRKDAQDTYRAASDKDSVMFGQAWSTASDRGTRDGFGNASSFTQHDIDANGQTVGDNSVYARSTSDRFVGNNPNGSGEEQTTQNALIGPPYTRTIFTLEIPTSLTDRTNSGNWAVAGANGSFVCNACDLSMFNFQQLFGICQPISSNKQSISRRGSDSFRGRGTISVTIGFAGIFGASADLTWGNEQSFDSGFSQRFVENHHNLSASTEIYGTRTSATENFNNLDGHSNSHDQMATRHNAHSNSESFRDTASNVKEATAEDATSDGEAHSGADRANHSERALSGQMTAYGQSHAESSLRMQSLATTRAEADYWDQISHALRALWVGLEAQEKEAQKIVSGTLPAATGKLVSRYNVSDRPGASCLPEKRMYSVLNRRFR